MNQNIIELQAHRQLNVKSLRMLVVGVIEQAILDYKQLVRRGILVRGRVHWPTRKGFKVDSMYDVHQAITARDFFAPGGLMEEYIQSAALDIAPDLIRQHIGWQPAA